MKLILNQDDKVSVQVVNSKDGQSITHNDLVAMVYSLHEVKMQTPERFSGEEIEDLG